MDDGGSRKLGALQLFVSDCFPLGEVAVLPPAPQAAHAPGVEEEVLEHSGCCLGLLLGGVNATILQRSTTAQVGSETMSWLLCCSFFFRHKTPASGFVQQAAT